MTTDACSAHTRSQTGYTRLVAYGDLLSIEQRVDGALLVLELHGELDISTAADLPLALGGVAREGASRLLVDLRGVTVLDSVGVRSLLHTRRWMFNRGGEARFVCDGGPALRTIELMGLRDALGVCADIASAQTELSGG